jgi:hypothetical protein
VFLDQPIEFLAPAVEAKTGEAGIDNGPIIKLLKIGLIASVIFPQKYLKN